jgi:hypothetical protein
MKFIPELGQRKQKIRGQEARIDFSFKREVFFIVAGGFIGALVMAIPMTFLSPGRSHGYDLTWIVFSWCPPPPSIHHYCWGNNSYNNWNFNWYSIRNISL